jgi:nitrogen fixation/metabolism regulation signal transduction histidine kinase
MLVLLLGSFFFIGIFTSYNFKKQNENYHDKRLIRKEAATLTSISYFLKSSTIDTDKRNIYQLFQFKIHEIADIHNIDLNIYSLEGEIIISSNKALITEKLIPKTLDKQNLKDLSENKERIKLNLIQNGEEYLNSFQYIYDQKGKAVAIISIPYFQLDETYKRDLQSYLVALSPIYIILFLGASIMAFLLSRQIIEPMRRLSQTMRQAALTKKYVPLRWHSPDEIGQLVHQYNFMVKELEKSAAILAKTEKESAWKEMAKQVAHEIKNPLTPMKLNIQLFERQLKAEDPDFDKKMRKFTASIVDQIDTLAHIASAFSDFARMPAQNKEVLNLVSLVENTVGLFDAADIHLEKEIHQALILADHDQIVRIMNNLLNNAIEAIPKGKESKITVNLKQDNHHWCIEVKDNGEGIPESLRKNIFQPNFTTKNSGTGLGLAMVKRIIDDLNGKIWFESEQNIGTSFFVCFPAHNKS